MTNRLRYNCNCHGHCNDHVIYLGKFTKTSLLKIATAFLRIIIPSNMLLYYKLRQQFKNRVLLLHLLLQIVDEHLEGFHGMKTIISSSSSSNELLLCTKQIELQSNKYFSLSI